MLLLSGGFNDLKKQVENAGGVIVGGEQGYNVNSWQNGVNLITRYQIQATTIMFNSAVLKNVDEIVFWNFRAVVDFNVSVGNPAFSITQGSYDFKLNNYLLVRGGIDNYAP